MLASALTNLKMEYSVIKPTFSTLSIDISDHIAHVALDRPDKANSINSDMWKELEVCFNWLDAESEVRVIILSGEGKHFCAGIDLAMFGELVNTEISDLVDDLKCCGKNLYYRVTSQL